MNDCMKISCVICTHNRSQSLNLTLESFRDNAINNESFAELLIIDNASTDSTKELVEYFCCELSKIRYVFESNVGLANARNRALQEAVGDIIVFTDDDVRFRQGWLDALCSPIISNKADAVSGGVALAPHLERPWMGAFHYGCLASTKYFEMSSIQELIGANMAFSRKVLHKVPGFDPELGAGALGFCEDSLFGRQLVSAGFRIAGAPDALIEHHPDPRRLSRESFLDRSIRQGICEAYIAYHWEHKLITNRLYNYLKHKMKLALYRWRGSKRWLFDEGIAEEEMVLISMQQYYLSYINLSFTKRKYDKFGLLKHFSMTPGTP